MKIKKGDTVKITTGKDAGKSGKVINIDSRTGKIVIEGLNVFKKHARPKTQNEKGQIVDVPRPMQASNVLLVCPSCHKPTRIGIKIDGTKKERVCKKCKATI
jgi:large subunit ribosomal protein L24